MEGALLIAGTLFCIAIFKRLVTQENATILKMDRKARQGVAAIGQ